ncbi:putative NRPS-like enzyme [Hypoxylon sp. FL1150]|nr:putative NRPS-like enzyme [Hypoxylon sp. FL1150]
MATKHASIAQWQNDLLPHIVDRLARDTPDALYGSWPVAPASYDAGIRTINYAQLANIVNGLAWWIVKQLGPCQNHEVLTYVGPNDVRFTALILGAMKAGYVLFLTSPRNSPAAHRGLFSSLKCRTLLTTDPAPPSVHSILEAVQPRKFTIPSIESLLEENYPHFNFDKSYEQARWDPLYVIHTSGSTGLPKPLIWTHETSARHNNFCDREPPAAVSSLDRMLQGKRVLSTLPPFHGAGLIHYLLYAIPFGNVVVAPAAAAIVTAQGFVDALKLTPADVAILVPSVVAELSQNPDLLEYCASHLELIIYIGGDLPQAIGDRVAARVPLRCQWGASEVGIPQQLIPAGLGRLDWRYTKFHPCVGATFEEAIDGTYELIIRRDITLDDTQPAFSIRGQEHLKEYRTRDLFERHPVVADAWCWRARADDILVFLNGEKTNPVSMEQHIVARNPELTGALVVGSQRLQAALLIEPVAGPLTTAEQAALIERVWPSVEEANRVAPAYARVQKTLIFITAPDRPLIRAGKGTIQRPASLAQYEAEIDKIYADMDAILEDATTDAPVDPTNQDEIMLLVRNTISTVTGWESIDDMSNFFDRGADSLQALQITRALRRGLRRADIALSTVYHNPSISQLTSALLEKGEATKDRDAMAPLLETYVGLIKKIPAPQSPAADTDAGKTVDVLLTGSTGTLGTYILHALLNRPGVGHIYVLNRGEDGGRAVQINRFATATEGLDRVTFLKWNPASPLLGLDEKMYEILRTHVGLIIHNAWPVNFNLALASFKPQLTGLVNLFALSAATAPRISRVVFISSVGAVSGRPIDAGPAPEAVLDSFDSPHGNGYGQSKFLSELLCNTATQHLGIPTTIARVGQVAGAVRRPGMWNRSEWLPSLVISSLHIGCLPDSLGPQFSEVDWMPSDMLADIVVDLANRHEAGDKHGAEVFNLRNPRTVRWDALIPAIRDAAERLGRTLDIVSPSTWLSRLEESMADVSKGDADALVAAVASNPAIKLMDFYREWLWTHGAASQPMAVERSLAASPTLRDMPPVSAEWMRKWFNEWMSL